MTTGNSTELVGFILMGLSNDPELQIPLFVVFLVIYTITLIGNLGMIILIKVDPQLHTPMYFFLSNLSFVDVCYSSVVTPTMLVNFIAQRKAISLAGCATQMWFFGLFVATECYLLAVMAYDRYVAISNPLLYMVLMSRRICAQLLAGPYIVGLVNAVMHTSFTFHLSFCNRVINHFFCDIPAVISLSCSDNHINKLVLFVLSGVLGTFSSLIVLASYIYILTAILRIRSAEGRCKAFSTCSSHLTAVTIFFGTLFFIYVCPSSHSSVDLDKVVSMFYTVVIPMLNPIIYSLRNKEVKDALRRVIGRKMLSLGT
ncbi:olfactory receptor 5G9 [Alligator mississippiensis]|uniref:olfactory receptor 5G9 n=1 Tax=Alligator mississippiensis TaxID=8496 RepID=UPI0003D0AF9C|nr:olfactory receptor 5G9 [Alligator mississippiensis]